MITPDDFDLLVELAHAGIELVVEGDRLRYRPPDAMRPEWADRIRLRKPALIDLLRTNNCDDEFFEQILNIAFARINAAWPRGHQMTEWDWLKLDRIETSLVETKDRGDLKAMLAAAADYVEMAHHIFQRAAVANRLKITWDPNLYDDW